MESDEITAALENARALPGALEAISDDKQQMVEAHRVVRELAAAMKASALVRKAAANRLRDGDRKTWTYKRIADACGTDGSNPSADGQAIVQGYRGKRRGASDGTEAPDDQG